MTSGQVSNLPSSAREERASGKLAPTRRGATAMTKAERLAAARNRFDETVKRLRLKVGDEAITVSDFRDNFRVVVDAARAYDVLASLKADGFDLLSELGGADYLHYPDAKDRYGVWYCLTNTKTSERVVVKTFANDPAP